MHLRDPSKTPLETAMHGFQNLFPLKFILFEERFSVFGFTLRARLRGPACGAMWRAGTGRRKEEKGDAGWMWSKVTRMGLGHPVCSVLEGNRPGPSQPRLFPAPQGISAHLRKGPPPGSDTCPCPKANHLPVPSTPISQPVVFLPPLLTHLSVLKFF